MVLIKDPFLCSPRNPVSGQRGRGAGRAAGPPPDQHQQHHLRLLQDPLGLGCTWQGEDHTLLHRPEQEGEQEGEQVQTQGRPIQSVTITLFLILTTL